MDRNQSTDRESTSTSVAGSSPPRSENGSGLRYKVTLEAQTAAMQRQEETPVTYLNKGQFYTVSLQDTEEYDGDITSVIKVTFHDASHRRLAARYWSFWLSQQVNPKTARALDIEHASSSGILEVQSKTFDRISFKWNGKAGAKLMVRFNCLSTDFSRIKGVKGIPLRVHMDSVLDNSGASVDQSQSIERAFAKIKLFRDKGAERKNKDDHKHLEKMWDKMRGKNADTNPLVSMLAPVQNVSVFSECLDHHEASGEDETLDLSETLALDSEGNDVGSNSSVGGGNDEPGSGGGSDDVLSTSPMGGESGSLVPASKKRRRLTEGGAMSQSSSNNNNQNSTSSNQSSNNSNNSNSGALDRHRGSGGSSSSGQVGLGLNQPEMFLDRDPTYVPQARKKRPVLCLYIKIGGESVYRAVYLEKTTLQDLIQKLSEKLEIQSSTISCVYRRTTKKDLMVRVDDAMVAQMADELDMVVEYDFNQHDGSVNLTLKY
ncbi:grainyhead-like [Podila horticola]|nr:grainyhead-like [Podila horticola]